MCILALLFVGRRLLEGNSKSLGSSGDDHLHLGKFNCLLV